MTRKKKPEAIVPPFVPEPHDDSPTLDESVVGLDVIREEFKGQDVEVVMRHVETIATVRPGLARVGESDVPHADSPTLDEAVEGVAAPGVTARISSDISAHEGLLVIPASLACAVCGTSREMMKDTEPCATCGKQLEDAP